MTIAALDVSDSGWNLFCSWSVCMLMDMLAFMLRLWFGRKYVLEVGICKQEACEWLSGQTW